MLIAEERALCSKFVDRAESLLLFTSGAADEMYWYGDALDDQFVTADVEKHDNASAHIGRFRLGAAGGVIGGDARSIKDSLASLDFPLGLLGEKLLGPLNSFLKNGAADNEIGGDDDRFRIGVVVPFVIVVGLASGDDDDDDSVFDNFAFGSSDTCSTVP